MVLKNIQLTLHLPWVLTSKIVYKDSANYFFCKTFIMYSEYFMRLVTTTDYLFYSFTQIFLGDILCLVIRRLSTGFEEFIYRKENDFPVY